MHPVPTQFESPSRVGLNSSALPFKQGQAWGGLSSCGGWGRALHKLKYHFLFLCIDLWNRENSSWRDIQGLRFAGQKASTLGEGGC